MKMKIVDPDSLAATLDRLNEVFFYGQSLSKSPRQQAAKWIAGRQGLGGSYAGMFAPTQADCEGPTKLFTGETIRTQAARSHILGEEACRALILLDVKTAGVGDALERAGVEMMRRLAGGREAKSGMYCCGRCSCALWRHLAVGGLDNGRRLLAAGVRSLKSYRSGNSRWRVFPFYYTLLVLTEIDLPSAVAEMRYAAPACERLLRRSPKDDVIEKRRRLLAERVLARC